MKTSNAMATYLIKQKLGEWLHPKSYACMSGAQKTEEAALLFFWLCCFAFLLALLLAFALICFRHCFAFALALLCFWCCCWLLLLLLALICFQHCFAFDIWACQRPGGRGPGAGRRVPAGGHRPESPGRRLTHQWRSKGEQVCGIWIRLFMLLRNTSKNNKNKWKMQ